METDIEQASTLLATDITAIMEHPPKGYITVDKFTCNVVDYKKETWIYVPERLIIMNLNKVEEFQEYYNRTLVGAVVDNNNLRPFYLTYLYGYIIIGCIRITEEDLVNRIRTIKQFSN